jgi:preprotein translocase SecE subunit
LALKIYRPEEGQRARGVIAAGLGAMGFYGVYSLYNWFAGGWWAEPLPGIGKSLGDELPITPSLILCTILTLALATGLYLLYNYQKWANFLIETEGELRKVSWASRRQVFQESLVVVVTVIVLGIYILGIDWVIITGQKRVPNWISPSNDPARTTTWTQLLFGARPKEQPK